MKNFAYKIEEENKLKTSKLKNKTTNQKYKINMKRKPLIRNTSFIETTLIENKLITMFT